MRSPVGLELKLGYIFEGRVRYGVDMAIPEKSKWRVSGSGGDQRLAIDNSYTKAWISDPSDRPWLQIDLGEIVTLGGLEVYWGKRAARNYRFEGSCEGEAWMRLCGTRHGEGGQEVFAFPPMNARFLRWASDDSLPGQIQEIVEINLYGPGDAASTAKATHLSVFGGTPVMVEASQNITVDFGYLRSVVGAVIDWGESFGTDFSVLVSKDGKAFREVGRMTTGDGGTDNFWWPTTDSRYLRLSVLEASSCHGAILNEFKPRILDKDRMPIGQLERAARAGRADLYPQSLLGRQVYWTIVGEADEAEEALFDEYGDLEPRSGFAQITPILRLGSALHGAPGNGPIRHGLVDGSLPIPSVTWSTRGLEVQVTALAHAGQALVEYRISNQAEVQHQGGLVLVVRPVQINPYWQHGGYAPIFSIDFSDRTMLINEKCYAVFSSKPDYVAINDFDEGDIVTRIDKCPREGDRTLRSDSGLLSVACEFTFSLSPGESCAFVAAFPMRDAIIPTADVVFQTIRNRVSQAWRREIGPRKISVGDREISDTIEAQTTLILVNATREAFKPGPRNYDRIWVRDGSSQAVALLWAGQIEKAKAYVIWYSKRIYKNGMVPPILNQDGSINRGYGSDIEFDAQGEFVGMAAEVYRISKDRVFLSEVFEPVIRATKFIEELCTRSNALHDSQSHFRGLLPPSISHEGYSKPSYSYWDDFMALSAWRNCEYLALEIGNREIAEFAARKGKEFAADLSRSLRMASEQLGRGMIAASADREDVDPTSTSIAFEPCRVEDVLPGEFIKATYDLAVADIGAPDVEGRYTPYILRNINALVALGRFEDAFRLLSVILTGRRPRGWRHWAEVIWNPSRIPEYIGDMPHTWIGAEFSTTVRRMLVREDGDVLQLFRAVPDHWWDGDGITLLELPTAFGPLTLRARRRESRVTVELKLDGPEPERVTLRYPGARLAHANGRPCVIDGDLISLPNFPGLWLDIWIS
jgi:hypothetical protein